MTGPGLNADRLAYIDRFLDQRYVAAGRLPGAITLVHVRWLFLDADGALLTDSTAYYVLRRDEDGPHACVCIQVDDASKLQALAADRGIDLAQFLPEPPSA